MLRDGQNQITVGVDSQATEATVPPPVTDWENYGGITRPVRLIATPDTYVDDAWVRLTRDGRMAVDVHLDGPEAANRAVRLRIAELGLDRAGTTDAHGNWRATMAAPRALVRWSPDRPKLYDVAIASGEDQWRDRIGFRTIEQRGADILLNGKPIFLRGISMHEEELGVDPTRAMTPAASRALLSEIKDGLHGNFVRLAHYPHSDVTVRLADELGLIVWSEVPVYWRVAWSNPDTLNRARDMLAENILRDRNRAAIAIWSVANETPVTDARNVFLRTLVGDVRRLDDTRLVSAALLVERDERADHPVMTLADPLAEVLDVMAINTYNGWYSQDRLADLARSEWRGARRQAADLLRIRCRRPCGFPRSGQQAEILRGVPGRLLPRDAEDGGRPADAARHVALDLEGLPIAPPPEPGFPAGVEPQGPDLRNGSAQGSLRRARRLLCPERGRAALTGRATAA